jgi:hypothetical protein
LMTQSGPRRRPVGICATNAPDGLEPRRRMRRRTTTHKEGPFEQRPPPGAPPSRTPFSQNLDRTFLRALAIAEERHHERAAPEHFLLALTDDPDAALVMLACEVDLDKLRLALSSSLSSQPTAPHGAAPSPDAGFQAIVQRAVLHVQSIGKNEAINGAHVLAAILVSTPAEPVAEFLRDQGMTRFDALSYISHGLRKGQVMPALDGGEPATGAAMLRVKLLNDDYTPMEFVVAVLERIFDHDRGRHADHAVGPQPWRCRVRNLSVGNRHDQSRTGAGIRARPRASAPLRHRSGPPGRA